MNKLFILDASVYLHSGTKSKLGQNRVHWGLHVGGIEKLAEAVNHTINNERDARVMVMFDAPTDRKEYMVGYKSDRVSDARVFMQQKLVLPALRKIGVQCFQEHGCEADDLIYEAVRVNYDKFNQIIIKTNDMDLAALVDEKGKVSIQSPTSISYDVTRKTYEKVLSGTSTAKEVVKRYKVKEETIEPAHDVYNYNYIDVVDPINIVIFNSITPFKLFFGDKSDGIPAFRNRTDIVHLYANFCRREIENGTPLERLSDASVMIRYYSDNPDNLTEEDLEELYNRINVFYPKSTTLDLEFNDDIKINTVQFQKMAVMFGLRNILKFYPTKEKTSSKQIEFLKDKAHKVRHGKVSVDYDLELNSSEIIQDETMENLDVYMGENVGGF